MNALVKLDNRTVSDVGESPNFALNSTVSAVAAGRVAEAKQQLSAAESSDWSVSHSSPRSNCSQGSASSVGAIGQPTVNGNNRDASAQPGNSTSNNVASSAPADSVSPAATDAEGVWSPDIEQSFQEALAIYPPCGRRKIILSEEGKMYGRNELIARYIKLRTGKTRTRKQVSSHIQVLARKKARELSAKLKDQGAKEKALSSLNNMSSAQIVSMSAMHNKMTAAGLTGLYGATPTFWQPGFSPPPPSTMAAPLASVSSCVDMTDVKPFSPLSSAAVATAAAAAAVNYGFQRPPGASLAGYSPGSLSLAAHHVLTPAWEGRTVSSSKIRLCEFSAYCLPNPSDPSRRHELVRINSSVTHTDPLLEAIDISQVFDKFPSGKTGLRELYERGPQNAFFLVKFWADISFNVSDEQSTLFAVDSRYESSESMTISVSTKVCSFGRQVVEKVEHEYPKFEKGRFVYRINRSPMCEYMNNFIHKLKKLPERYMMNSVLENFTILQLVTTKDTQETLLCIAFVFEISDGDGSQHRVYRLTHAVK